MSQVVCPRLPGIIAMFMSIYHQQKIYRSPFYYQYNEGPPFRVLNKRKILIWGVYFGFKLYMFVFLSFNERRMYINSVKNGKRKEEGVF